jgi:hypothetical protein
MLREINPRLSWEIGPGLVKNWQLVISPNLNPKMRRAARAFVGKAPRVPGWEFHDARQPKQWDYKLELAANHKLRLDASAWKFVLLQYPDNDHEILLIADELPVMSDDERWQAAAIALESILGEAFLLDSIQSFELTRSADGHLVEQARPIQELRHACGM